MPDPLPPPQPPEEALDTILAALDGKFFPKDPLQNPAAAAVNALIASTRDAARAELASLRALLRECEEYIDTVNPTDAAPTDWEPKLLSKFRAARGSQDG